MNSPISNKQQTHNNKNNTARKAKYKDQFVEVSYYIANSKILTNLDKTVWEFYHGASIKSRSFYPTTKYIAITLGVDRSNILRSRNKLIRLDYLKRANSKLSIKRYLTVDKERGIRKLAYLKFPKEISYAHKGYLTSTQKAILRALMVKQFTSNEINMTIDDIIGCNRISKKSLRIEIKNLVDGELIKVTRNKGAVKNTYILTDKLKLRQLTVINKDVPFPIPDDFDEGLSDPLDGQQKSFSMGNKSRTLKIPIKHPSYADDENSCVDNSPPPQQRLVKKTGPGKELNTPLEKSGSGNSSDVQPKAPHTASNESQHQDRIDTPVSAENVYSLESRNVHFKKLNEMKRLRTQMLARQLEHDHKIRTSERTNRITKDSDNKIFQPTNQNAQQARKSKSDGFSSMGSLLPAMISSIDPR